MTATVIEVILQEIWNNMKDSKVVLYRNSRRNDPEKTQPYVPQHVTLGIEPQEIGSGLVQQPTSDAIQSPKTKPVVVQFKPVTQSYAEVSDSPIGVSSVPNVGNNMEHTWSSVDGEIIDDLPQDFKEGHVMVDNNELVTDAALGVSFGGNQRNRNPLAQMRVPLPIEPEASAEDVSLLEVVKDLETDTYLLLVGSEPLCSGPLQEIEEQVNALIFGNHELFDGQSVPEEEIVVLKKLKIKVGVFLV